MPDPHKYSLADKIRPMMALCTTIPAMGFHRPLLISVDPFIGIVLVHIADADPSFNGGNSLLTLFEDKAASEICIDYSDATLFSINLMGMVLPVPLPEFTPEKCASSPGGVRITQSFHLPAASIFPVMNNVLGSSARIHRDHLILVPGSTQHLCSVAIPTIKDDLVSKFQDGLTLMKEWVYTPFILPVAHDKTSLAEEWLYKNAGKFLPLNKKDDICVYGWTSSEPDTGSPPKMHLTVTIRSLPPADPAAFYDHVVTAMKQQIGV